MCENTFFFFKCGTKVVSKRGSKIWNWEGLKLLTGMVVSVQAAASRGCWGRVMASHMFPAIPSRPPPLPSPPQMLLPPSHRPSHPQSPLPQDFFSDHFDTRVEIRCWCGWWWVRVCDRGLPAFSQQPPSCVTACSTVGGREGSLAAHHPWPEPTTAFLTHPTTISHHPVLHLSTPLLS